MRNYFVYGLFVMLSACSAPRKVVLPEPSSVLVSASGRGIKAHMPFTCAVHVTSITDERDDRENLGSLGRSVVVLEDARQWLSTGLQALDGVTYRFIQTKDLPADAIGLKSVKMSIALKQLYMRGVRLSTTANIVVQVRFMDEAGKPSVTHVVRGVDTSVNWVGADTEISNGFDLALEHLLAQLNAQLVSACGDHEGAVATKGDQSQ